MGNFQFDFLLQIRNLQSSDKKLVEKSLCSLQVELMNPIKIRVALSHKIVQILMRKLDDFSSYLSDTVHTGALRLLEILSTDETAALEVTNNLGLLKALMDFIVNNSYVSDDAIKVLQSLSLHFSGEQLDSNFSSLHPFD